MKDLKCLSVVYVSSNHNYVHQLFTTCFLLQNVIKTPQYWNWCKCTWYGTQRYKWSQHIPWQTSKYLTGIESLMDIQDWRASRMVDRTPAALAAREMFQRPDEMEWLDQRNENQSSKTSYVSGGVTIECGSENSWKVRQRNSGFLYHLIDSWWNRFMPPLSVLRENGTPGIP